MKRTNKTIRTYGYRFMLLTLIGVFGISCSPESTVPVDDGSLPYTAGDPAVFNALRAEALTTHMEKETFNAEDGVQFTSNDGAEIQIFPNCLLKDGDVVTGQVELTFIDLYEKRDMATTNKPTMGLMQNGDKAPLVSGGEFFIEVRQDGDLLQMGCQYQLMVPGDNTGGTDPEMVLWNGLIDENGNLTWDEVEEEDNAQIYNEGGNYYVFAEAFGWTNIDRFYNDPRPKTTLLVDVPEGFDFDNSAVYLSYDGEANGLAHLDTFIAENGYFSEHYGQIPIGLEAHLIFMSADGDNWRYAIQGVTIAENEVYTFTIEDTQVDSFENVTAAINSLP
ncbi:hypothetical protein [Marixanthomonas spongiae]|uniref:Uncharacterized protein n=1 Tax=Marixanthomonas spongiae TaxID=2174845 RepID=A0A2U0HZC1_9FLAO|nr:hypothetical protein [Marixanthomonas spongiae]PVW14213.1 hypothetical protein DDV96_10415 [Marixanthomonas spongiae]